MAFIPLGQLLAHHAARDPRRPAITFGDEVVTREELEARANRRARVLRDRGVGQGDMVTIALPNGLELYELQSTLAAAERGARALAREAP